MVEYVDDTGGKYLPRTSRPKPKPLAAVDKVVEAQPVPALG